MGPSRRKSASKAAAAAAARRQWKIGDLVLAKVKGFPAWPATVSEPEKWGYSTDWKKVLVYFFGTKQIAFCNPVDVEEFTEEKKELLLGKRQGRGADFVRAVQEIVDCFDKLKQNNGVDQQNSGGAPVENAAVNGDISAFDASVPDATHNATEKSSNSSRLKDQHGTTLEDVGALTDVEVLRQRGLSEEPENNAVGPCLALPNTYTLKKKSRSSQAQQSTNKKKGSAQRSRSSLHFNPHGLQNGESKCNNSNNSDDCTVNGFLDGPLRKAKRSKRSPELPGTGVSDSPICNSNGTVEDNGSEVAIVDSENISNEGSAIESDHKREHVDILSGSCEGGFELCRGFDFQATSIVVRKKRNPGRKRAQNDGLESVSRSDVDVRNETQVLRDNLGLQACQSLVNTHPKDEGDEHLPLVKRARVRMGKMLAEENHQLDFVVQTEEKCLESVSTNSFRLATTNCDDIHSSKLTGNELMSSPVDNHNQVSANRPQSPKTDVCVINESVLCSPVDNHVQIVGDKPQTSKTKTNHSFGDVFDGEAALPPSKRLHRALEAMSANAAEENHTSLEASLSTEVGAEETKLLLSNSNSDMIVNHEAGNMELQKCNNALTGDHSRSHISKPSCYEAITKSLQEVSMSDSPDKILVCQKADNADEMIVCMDSKDIIASESIKPGNILPDQASQVFLNNINDSGPLLHPVLTEPLLELSKLQDEEMLESGTERNKSENEVLSGGVKISSIEEETVVGCSTGTTADECGEEARISAANDILMASLDKNAKDSGICIAVDEAKYTEVDKRMDVSSSALVNVSSQRTSHGASVSGFLSIDLNDVRNATTILPLQADKQKQASIPNNMLPASDNSDHSPRKDSCPMDAKISHVQHTEDAAESRGLDVSMGHQGKLGERTNLAEVKAALASLELTLGSLTRTKESIGRATRIAVDCVKFGSAAEVVDLLVLYLEKESSLYRRVDIFFLVDSIAQCSRGLKGEVGGAYISAVKGTLARMLSAAAPPGQAGRENRRQCLKVLRLWLERKMFPESIICQHIRELDSLNCSSSTGGHSRRMSRTERSFDDPLRDMEGMMVDEYGSNSSFQLPGFCMPRMLKEEDDGSDSDEGSFEAVTPEHDSKYVEPSEATAVVTTEKHRHILEDVDGELEMEDVAPSSVIAVDRSATTAGPTAPDSHSCKEQFSTFVPPLPHDVPPRAPPLPKYPPPLPPLPPPPPPPPPPPLAPHVSSMPRLDADSQLHVGRNSMQEAIAPRPPAPGIHHPMQMPPSTSCSYNSYPVMHNPVAPGNNIQPMDGNLYGNTYNHRAPYPSSNQFSYLPPDQVRPQREGPPPPYYDRSRFGQGAEVGQFYGDHDNFRPSRHEMTDGWGYSRPPYPSPCEPRPNNHGWAFPPPPVHHQNHFPSRPPCDGGVTVAARAPGYWHPR